MTKKCAPLLFNRYGAEYFFLHYRVVESDVIQHGRFYFQRGFVVFSAEVYFIFVYKR